MWLVASRLSLPLNSFQVHSITYYLLPLRIDRQPRASPRATGGRKTATKAVILLPGIFALGARYLIAKETINEATRTLAIKRGRSFILSCRDKSQNLITLSAR